MAGELDFSPRQRLPLTKGRDWAGKWQAHLKWTPLLSPSSKVNWISTWKITQQWWFLPFFNRYCCLHNKNLRCEMVPCVKYPLCYRIQKLFFLHVFIGLVKTKAQMISFDNVLLKGYLLHSQQLIRCHMHVNVHPYHVHTCQYHTPDCTKCV